MHCTTRALLFVDGCASEHVNDAARRAGEGAIEAVLRGKLLRHGSSDGTAARHSLRMQLKEG